MGRRKVVGCCDLLSSLLEALRLGAACLDSPRTVRFACVCVCEVSLRLCPLSLCVLLLSLCCGYRF